jgi:hypothetical protein
MPNVKKLRFSGGEHHFGRFDVAVHDTEAVRGSQRGGDLACHRHRLPTRHRTRPQPIRQALRLDSSLTRYGIIVPAGSVVSP